MKGASADKPECGDHRRLELMSQAVTRMRGARVRHLVNPHGGLIGAVEEVLRLARRLEQVATSRSTEKERTLT